MAGLAFLAFGGCASLEELHTESDLAQVSTSPFAASTAPTVKRARLNFPPAAAEISMRVDAVGRTLLAANPQTSLKLLFAAIAAPQPEIFHVCHADLTMVYVTEGLVRQCKSEAELAAVLASELGKAVSQREAAASRAARVYEPPPPLGLPIGSQGNPLASDPIHQVELARYEKEHPRAARRKIVPPPDPLVVAGTILEQAGFQKTDLDMVAPILRAAELNGSLQRQFNGVAGPDGTGWRPQ
jgi:hypothetical protein